LIELSPTWCVKPKASPGTAWAIPLRRCGSSCGERDAQADVVARPALSLPAPLQTSFGVNMHSAESWTATPQQMGGW